jgi:hypothetical protein
VTSLPSFLHLLKRCQLLINEEEMEDKSPVTLKNTKIRAFYKSYHIYADVYMSNARMLIFEHNGKVLRAKIIFLMFELLFLLQKNAIFDAVFVLDLRPML